jgi:protein-export membrane protein, SecD/SecF family
MKKGKSVVSLILLAVVAAALAVGAKLSVGKIKLGLDLNGGAAIVYQAEKEDVTEDEMKSAVSLIQRRLDRKGWTEGEASMQGSNRIRVEIPGIEDAETAVTELGQTAQLLFVDENGKTLLTGADVADAQMNVSSSTKDGPSQPCVSLEFTEEGKALFAQATEENLNKRIAIVMDNQIISAPTVNSKITDGKAMITGQFTSDEATEMAIRIKEGSLPFNLSVIEMNNVGARLGANAVVTSLKAAAVGICLVLLFMLITYMACGFAADWALIIYMGLEIIAISVFGVTLTLPGIAGIILSVGMAVDANVIIFERIKEEVILGKTLRTAVDNGFSRALPAILDGNITTFIAAVVLFFMGTGTIRGFAQTLMIGIVISMFTAIVITRLIMKSIIGMGISKPELFGIKKVEKA